MASPDETLDQPLLVAIENDDEADSPVLPQEFGDYRLIRLLGKGGMGVVYEAERISTGRRVALKMLGAKFDSPDMRQRFLREGRMAAGVSHPNSVYVFGSEEIEGLPVITMEVVGGGTLQDVLSSRGRLPVVESVDAMLDIVDGLEAALAGDVLHRDIKPSNCFVDRDGRVKVGDFGLSVSAIASVDTFATQSGVALGTPAYAAPEQLRGDELDCRSDIYSVGATLFTLLAGDPPFQGNNPVQIVAAVLDQTPPKLDSLRVDVSPELVACVAKCLAKKPDQRYESYAALRAALLPHSSRLPDPEPAPVLRRAMAGMIDLSIAWLIPRAIVASNIGVLSLLEIRDQFVYWTVFLAIALCYLGYFALSEGVYGCSVGKWLLGMKVTCRRGRAIGVRKAILRAAIAFMSLQGMLFLQLAIEWSIEFGWSRPYWPRSVYAALYVFAMLIVFVLPMLTMRRTNQYATFWDWITDSRVVLNIGRAIPIETPTKTASEAVNLDVETIGPYQFIRYLREPSWIETLDPALQRLVWLRRRDHDEDRSDRQRVARHEVARSTRTRWLQSVSRSDGVWDAFAVAPGRPLRELLDVMKQHDRGGFDWQSTRHWLLDLTLEIASAVEDGTLPKRLSLDHVWITTQGRAVLLDQPFPPTNSAKVTESSSIDVTDNSGRQQFLSTVANCTLAYTIPIHAQGILRNLSTGSFDQLTFLAGSLRSLLTKPAKIDRGSRVTALLTLPLFLIAMSLLSVQATERTYRAAALHWTEQYPGLPPLSDVLRFRDQINTTAGTDVVGVHVAAHYAALRDQLNRTGGVQSVKATIGDNAAVMYLQRILNEPQEISPRELAVADRSVERFVGEQSDSLWLIGPTALYQWLVSMVALIAILQLPFLMIARTTLGQHVFSYAVVDSEGSSAGRLQLLVRWIITWTPVTVAMLASTYWPLSVLALVPWFAGLVFAIAHPQRGWQERWSRTWLVPR
ncbi:Serine/threonine-protein kinase PknB [Rubripirellula amarantea]|uniref:Serine/threonine-protein kinase PknB n=1 Tax=Rubripirellula amarantea TaxID=2527999 RepID=A0A5C5WM12_9BACT|nr:protein kinase [Rubripirellula amarantea]TWT51121.1 Serine/threonine-protein kinase PknB [Rubripirellula amarantea]